MVETKTRSTACSKSAKGRRDILCFPRHAMHSREKSPRGDTWRHTLHPPSVQPPQAALTGNTPHTRERRGRVRRRLRSHHGKMALQLTVRSPAASDRAPRSWQRRAQTASPLAPALNWPPASTTRCSRDSTHHSISRGTKGKRTKGPPISRSLRTFTALAVQGSSDSETTCL